MNKFLTQLRTKWGRDDSVLTPHLISWDIAPKINAVFRNGSPKLQEQMFRAFVGEGDADDAIKMMSKCHREQTALVKQLFTDSLDKLQQGKNYVATAIPTEYRAYTGLLAGKLSDAFNCPAFVLRDKDDNYWSGSMRSPVDILNLINASGLADCQGHEQAAGILIEKSKLKNFFTWMDEQDIDVNNEAIEVAAVLDHDEITLELCREIQDHAYLFGNDLKMPLFYTEFQIPNTAVPLCGKNNDTFRFPPFIKFKCNDEELAQLHNGLTKTVQAVVELSVNSYGGNDYPQAMIKKWEIINHEVEPEMIDFDAIFN